jgi:peptide subunit release factor RF-3
MTSRTGRRAPARRRRRRPAPARTIRRSPICDKQAFREGHLTPVFFGSALRNFGVGSARRAGRIRAAAARAEADEAHVDRGDEPR